MILFLRRGNVQIEPPSQKIGVTITGTGYTDLCYVVINGKTYISKTVLKVNVGDTITCYAKYASQGYTDYGGVYLDGRRVSKNTYNHVVSESDGYITIQLSKGTSPVTYYTARITRDFD